MDENFYAKLISILKMIGYVGTKQVDETNIAGGKILEYDANDGKMKYVDKPSGTGATLLNELSDVDTTTVVPTEGDILEFNSGKWMPVPNANVEGYLFIEDFINEDVELARPLPINKVNLVDKTQTNIDISWEKSDDRGVSFKIYVDEVLHGSTNELNYSITDLAHSTSYSIKVASVNKNGEESKASTVVIKTWGINHLFVPNGKGIDYIDIPQSELSAVGFVGAFGNQLNTWSNDILNPLGYSESLPYQLEHQFDGARFIINGSNMRVYADGMELSHNASIDNGVEKNYIFQIKDLKSVNDSIRLFGKATNGLSGAGGILKDIRVYKINERNRFYLIGYYDFTYIPSGNRVEDELGNLGPITIIGCQFN